MSSPGHPEFETQEQGAQPASELITRLPGQQGASEQTALAAGPPPPTENPAWNIWDVLLIAGLTFLTILVAQFAIVLVAHYFFRPHIPLLDLAQEPILLLLSQFVIDGAVVAYLFLWVEGKYRTPFWSAIRWNWPRSEWKLLVVGAAMLLVLSLLEQFLPMPKDTPFEKLFARPRDAYLLAIIAVSLGPLVEELFFRGLFYPVLARRLGAAWGIILTALPFALMHMPQYGYAWGALLVVLIVGIVCGVVRATTKSVAASFLVHVGYNGTQMLIAVVATHGFRHMENAAICWPWSLNF